MIFNVKDFRLNDLGRIFMIYDFYLKPNELTIFEKWLG